MNKVDLLRMSLSSLWRRKLRTVLTVLGVVVGTASIVVMISLGLGLDKSSMEQIEQYGGLTTITVYPNESGYSYTTYSGGGVMIESSSSSDSSSNEPIRIDDAMMETLSQIEHVEVASPVLSISALAKQGIWEGNIYIRGMSQEALEKMNLSVESLTLLTSETVPDDAAAIIINGPTTDFSADDAQKVADYLAGGGKALITSSYEATGDMTNFNSILSQYGLNVNQGMIMEGDMTHCYQYPYYLSLIHI